MRKKHENGKYFIKAQADRYLWKIYRRIQEEEVIVRLDSNIEPLHATLTYDDNSCPIITINPQKQIIHCFVHEYLHIFFGVDDEDEDKIENMILDMEQELVNEYWSDRQLENLLKRLTELIRIRPGKADVDLHEFGKLLYYFDEVIDEV